MKYYLLDYENVNTAGLDGLGELPEDSKIILFYTRNSNKIDLGVVNLLRDMKAELSIVEVHHGKQALDIQLASYLGYLIGTEPADTEYFIISKDKGYRNVQCFWPDRHIVLCKNLTPDSEIVDEPAEEKKPASRSRSRRRTTAAKASKPVEKKVEEKVEPKPEPKAEPATEKPVEEPKPNAFAEAAAIAKAVVEAKKARNEAEAKAEKKKATKASKNTKSAKTTKSTKDTKDTKTKKTAKPKQRISDIRAEVNNQIQRVLSKENFPGEVVNSTASFVSKNVGKEGYKQTVYRGIIKENGQKQGLAIYRLIKDII